jgi:non-ribosomal peptide synthetase component F
VLLLFPQGALSIAAVLGVLKAGKFYVPLDPGFPHARNQFIANDSQAAVVLTTAEHAEKAQSLSSGSLQLLVVEDLPGPSSEDDPRLELAPDTPAFIIYTSGSTGQPKGVLQAHESLVHNAWRQTEAIGFTLSDRLTSLYSTSVMGHVRDLYNALLNGAGLWSFDLRAQGVARLADGLVSEQITVLHTIASVFRHMTPTLPPAEALAHVRMLILGGESVLATDFEIFRARFPSHTKLFTGLGSTETGTARALLLERGDVVNHAILPLGHPVAGVEVRLMDPSGVVRRAWVNRCRELSRGRLLEPADLTAGVSPRTTATAPVHRRFRADARMVTCTPGGASK